MNEYNAITPDGSEEWSVVFASSYTEAAELFCKHYLTVEDNETIEVLVRDTNISHDPIQTFFVEVKTHTTYTARRDEEDLV